MTDALKTPMLISSVPAGMDCVIEVHASQYRKDVSLEEGDEELKTGQGDGHDQGKNGTTDAERAQGSERGNEACEHLERDMASEHVGEETNRKRNRTGQEGDDFDDHHQRQEN